ncbi:hypothetical protein A3K48_06080 [candidate division WOR-1 bacterium RIFOXYA12_FULL_52_29]|uniref:Uncharacterized protein n=1 Tax=candidate division WOR-1 bacterium RIFOXYC12_FULL_54_18 TaxID=1802584 RepID=A0A1F4T7J4_UNCSA|nr:MAG: hypothetical protein A3K44_06080 [candidate division WOR-1 bacterium RIFOXYA2_FULL_51_19]OGC18100.1 MAG: hypothetical protein A3K48_06080 [candidate division WOR-1 bacterium RIFOXYA12_FULL_52_29]OGC26956.1 MAG: hypothetical protein A3K32_06075 [candidate division WOR-1 bacterium RIFOXYB2_FULL_45_9]OGC28517.1 MAG: hypothetical protein A3K49_06080 [candidate division WOR-1 bacterium RIFOXYC12_FULL_54_18]OGC31028.1 MAG: hypothetical protein A2346_06540 [candidate division WOR-1 bacterium R
MVFRDLLPPNSSRLFVKLVEFLISDGHSNQLGKVSEAYTQLYSEMEGVSLGQIVSAVPLDDNTIKGAETSLRRIFDRNIKLKNDVNPSIMGGIIIKIIGGMMIDLSLKKTLTELKYSLANIPV